MDTPVLADKQKLTFISSVQTLGAVWRIYEVQWLIGTDGKRVEWIQSSKLCGLDATLHLIRKDLTVHV